MKKIFTLALTLLLSLTLFGQGKLIKSSAKSQPKWVKRSVDKYEIVKVSATSTISLETAKQIAFAKLKSDVIIASTRYMLSMVIDGNESTIRSQVENSQFIKNISELASIETYWEERYDRRSEITNYNFYVLYHFNDFEMKKIALEINRSNSSVFDDAGKL